MVFDRPTAPTPSKLPPPPTRPSIAQTVKAAADPGYTRLHITPFDADLLSVVVPASARPSARNVSFHSLQTFPEKRYGFVDLPTEAAEKLRRKLNGAVLKGVKLRIEPARQSNQEAEAAVASTTMGKSELTSDERQRKEEERAARKEKKRADKARGKTSRISTEREEVVGVQLEAGRQVKRGWTEPESAAELSNKKTNWSKDKKDKKEKGKSTKKRAEKSEYTDKPECLFKTILPANKVAMPAVPTPKDGEEAVDSRAARRARKEAKKAREVVVHEFANWTRIPTFLKSGGAGGTNAGNANLEYVDGKGWVDEATGDVVQPLKSTRPVAVKGVITKEAQLAKRAKLDAVAADRARAWKGDEASESESTGLGSGSETSSSGSDSSEEDDDDGDKDEDEVSDPKDEPVPSAEEATLLSPTRPRSSGSGKNLMIKIPPPPTFATPSTPGPKKEVHPLEALYKRAKPETDAAKQAATPSAGKDKEQPFSFFGGMNNDDIEDEEGDSMDVVTVENSNSKDNENENDDADPQPPMTPFGRAEFEWRNVRSAAPTPDTAHPSRMTSIFKWPTPGGASDDEGEDDGAADDDDDGDEDEKVDGDKDRKEKAAGEGDFQSWFWDNRGDLNRSWKRRRKTAAKDKRYRENRARAERAI
ncbi:hypothetical protein HMPREF1624_02146 [Sporothrix schenckii ATCC 58251]|uniref:Uncharacterized protein n=1 Tax=Sporothrix schenckii (strain ATCC 58251 / de Perez 2211183) TaxID=1391915 RepID=U7Q172_SPOS1|nr:hypothetical protein HMPREF1624_02146 [Sporothrix schenckii ATCC 58251]